MSKSASVCYDDDDDDGGYHRSFVQHILHRFVQSYCMMTITNRIYPCERDSRLLMREKRFISAKRFSSGKGYMNRTEKRVESSSTLSFFFFFFCSSRNRRRQIEEKEMCEWILVDYDVWTFLIDRLVLSWNYRWTMIVDIDYYDADQRRVFEQLQDFE